MSDQKVKLSREDVAKIEVGHTDLTRSIAWTLSLAFLCVIFLVPAVQALREKGPLGCLEILRAPGHALQAFASSEGSFFHRLMVANRSLLLDIHTYEERLEDESFLTKTLVPPAQLFMARSLGGGNEKAYIGRDKWLFYRPDLDYLTGPGFLNPCHLARRAVSGNEWTPAPQPDPRQAILEFRDQLAERGIALVVMPVPVKPGVHPERFSKRYQRFSKERPLHNVSYEDCFKELRDQGVLVCELDEDLKRTSEGEPRYLATDTHWRPEIMDAVAQRLADFLKEKVSLPALPKSNYKRLAQEVSNHGDVTRMMKLPENQTYFEPETVRIQQVLNAADEFWRPSASADVLILGDSFSNIFSLASMEWGSSAGLAEQLSFHLQRPLDVIIRNDEGSNATRGALSRDLARGKDRLEGKRVVIWQFAERELALGDWKSFDMQLGQAQSSQFVVPSEGTEMIVTGIVEAVSGTPRPGSVVYPDHIFAIHLSQLRDDDGLDIPDGEAVVYLFSMRGQKSMPASRLRPGREVRLSLRSWSDVEQIHGSIRRSELDNEDLMFEEPCWGEILGEK